ncbi:MAG TPA: hypothetical protein VHD32_07105 [Candidatus Didemnitutus sp.]|nr:hypothetical protein [Candidatus Didemnitutus sp.]
MPISTVVPGAAAFSLALAFAGVIASCGGGGGDPPATGNTTTVSGGGGATPPPVAPTQSLFLGVQTHFGQSWEPALEPKLPAAGITDIRDELYWQVIEPTAGTFTFPSFYDTYMGALKKDGVDPLIEFDFENSNYDGGNTPYTDAGIAAYVRYTGAVLNRYGSQIHNVEIWNEYNGSFAKGPATNDRPGTYTKMLKAAYTSIKASRPDITVVGGSTAGVPLPYFDQMFTDGALDYMDAVSIHPYRYESPPEGIEAQVTGLQNLMASHGKVLPIWVTEIGWFLHTATAQGDITIDEPTQAKFLVRAYALLLSTGVKHIYWYVLRDDSSGPPLGLIADDANLTTRQSYSAMRTMIGKLRTATFAGRDASAANFYSMHFLDANKHDLRVLWSLSSQKITIPSGTAVVDLFDSTITPSGGQITVSDSPVYVSGAVSGLPTAETAYTSETESDSSFSLQQGKFGWSYGYFLGNSTQFTALTQTDLTDWRERWIGSDPYLSITSVDQHPSHRGKELVTAVRRWTSDFTGTIHVQAHFKVGTQGDGVRLRILADGQALYADQLSKQTSIARDFEFERKVRPGSTLDFAVDPGAAGDISYDATAVSVVIDRSSS